MKGYKEESLWSREQARQRYSSTGMCGADVAAKRKNGGSDLTGSTADTAREPTKASFPDKSESEKEK
jgi:hypothetical protein